MLVNKAMVDAQVEITNGRVKMLYEVICNGLHFAITKIVMKKVTNFAICNQRHVTLVDLGQICEDIVTNHQAFKPDLINKRLSFDDRHIVDNMLTFQTRHGAPVPNLSVFSKYGINIPIVQRVIDLVRNNGMTAFDVTDRRRSRLARQRVHGSR